MIRRSLMQTSIAGLFWEDTAYEDMGATPGAFGRGLLIVVIVGLILGLTGAVGRLLAWASTPDMVAVKDTVYQGLTQMPWYSDAARSGTFVTKFREGFDTWWQVTRFFWPSPGSALLSLVTTPLVLLVRWFLYGLLAFIFARLLGGRASLAVHYGVLSLAAVPQVLNAVQIVPGAQAGGVFFWALISSYLALKKAHGLPPRRAFWAAVLPYVTVLLLMGFLFCIGGFLLSAMIGGAR